MIHVESMNRLLDERKAMHRGQVYATTASSLLLYGILILSIMLVIRHRTMGRDLPFTDSVEIDLITPMAAFSQSPEPDHASEAASASTETESAADGETEPAAPPEENAAPAPVQPTDTSFVEETTPEATPTPRRTRRPRPVRTTEPSRNNGKRSGGDAMTGSHAVPGAPLGSVESTALHQPGYAWYKLAIIRKVSLNWQAPMDLSLRKGTAVTVHFIIRKNGNIENLDIIEPSGNSLFDRAAHRAILKSSPLPALPAELGLDRLGVKYKFEYR